MPHPPDVNIPIGKISPIPPPVYSSGLPFVVSKAPFLTGGIRIAIHVQIVMTLVICKYLYATHERIGLLALKGEVREMDPVTLIVTALAAGTASALQDGTSTALKDAYARLKALVKMRFANRPKAALVLAEHEAAPQIWEAPLAAELSAAGADDDPELIAAAQALMALADVEGAGSGKYVVTASGAQGVQVGDHNTQTNTFGARPA